MAPLKVKSWSDSDSKKSKCIAVKTRKEAITKHKNGACVYDFTKRHVMDKSVIYN